MLLKSLEKILRSRRGAIQSAIIYDRAEGADIENGCSIEYAVKVYGDCNVELIEAFGNSLLITVSEGSYETRCDRPKR